MINLLALSLLISSLVAASVLSPPHPDPKSQDHLVREGHRVIVFEYERQLAPSDHPSPPPTTHRLIQEAKKKFHQASSHLPEVGQGISTPESIHEQSAATSTSTHSDSTKEKICDAYGVCKEKISSLFAKGKGKASEIEEKAKDSVNSVKDKASEIEEKAKDSVNSVKDKASEIEEKAKDSVKRTVDVTKEAGEDVAGNLTRFADKASGRAGEVKGNMTDILRRAREVFGDAAAHVKAPETARVTAAVVHLLALAVAYGTSVWVTFVSSHVLATALPKQQFGVVQSKLYPVYFRAVAYGIAVALLCQFFGRDRKVVTERVQGYNLLAAMGLVLVNMLYFEPKATKVMFERMKVEKEEGRGRDVADVVTEPVVTTSTATTTTSTPTATFGMRRATVAVDQEVVKSRMVKLSKKLKRLNSYSSLLNILTLMGLTWHLVHLARCQVAC